MTEEQVEIGRETLKRLREFADGAAGEYGDLDVFTAILDAGLVLGLDDPTPYQPPERMDLEAYRSWSKCDDEDIDEYVRRYEKHSKSQ